MRTALADYATVLRCRWRWPMWGALLALAATTTVLLANPPMYRTDARVFVRTPGDVSRVLDGGDSYAQGRARTYAALANSTSLASRVITDLGVNMSPQTLSGRIEASNPPGTALINVAVSAPTAGEATQTATVLLTEYAAMMHTLETVPGSVVPRAELIVVDPPGVPVRVVAWGLPVSLVLLATVFLGLVLGATAAVLSEVLSWRGPRRAPQTGSRLRLLLRGTRAQSGEYGLANHANEGGGE
jgi:capsular polysaccharide biosynthesis protein